MKGEKQAVLLIHGIGFQRPMRTLRGFVERVWTEDETLRTKYVPSTVWSKPDTVSRSFELRRLTTARNRNDVRTDFFEFYWAHLMRGNTLGEIWLWAKSLLLRSPGRIPAPLRLPYALLWLMTLFALVALVNGALPAESRIWNLSPWLTAIGSAVALPLLAWVLREVVGDAAVYLDPTPSNIQRRHEIRSSGVELLKELHKRGYARIVVVGHSLGTVIGYDMLKYLWAEMHDGLNPDLPQATAARDALEKMLDAPDGSNHPEFVKAQRAYLQELQASGHRWRVTDFITLGSPLTHAEVLLAEDRADLRRQAESRELPTCPPMAERSANGKASFCFEKKLVSSDDRKVPRWVPDHAAVFAPTVWTNLYFPAKLIVGGDFIGGPLRGQFGRGILDVPVRTSIFGGLLSHTHYWSKAAEKDDHVAALRRALDLART